MNLFKRLSFKVLNKSKVLIIDETNQKINFDLNEAELINPRKIYFLYLIKAVLKIHRTYLSKKIIKIIYLKEILKSVKPNLIIGNNINGLIFKFKECDFSIKTIMYQHSYIYDHAIEDFKKNYKNKHVDYFCVFDDRHRYIFKNFVNCKFLLTGSLIYNNNYIKPNPNKEIDILYISEFRNNSDIRKVELEKQALISIDKYCKKNKLKFYIAFNSYRVDKQINSKEEVLFYDNLNINYFFKKESSLLLASKSNLVICFSSNFGIEVLSSKNKVLFLNYMYQIHIKFKNPFFYPNSNIALTIFDEKTLYDKLNLLTKINEEEWKKLDKGIKYSIVFDEKNYIFKKIVNKILNEK